MFACISKKRARYKKMLQKAESCIKKELDLTKFMQGKRM